jgi:hypothetical protein
MSDSRLLTVLCTFLFVLIGTLVGSGDEVPGKARVVTMRSLAKPRGEWHLALVDGAIGFVAEGRPVPPGTTPPAFPSDGNYGRTSSHFVRDGSLLRANIWKDERERSREQAEKDGWCLTGDYSTTPPRVVLTKEPTKYSRWKFWVTKPFNGEGYDSYISNENDLGKTAWLTVDAKGTIYRGGQEVRKPVLSFDKDHALEFFVENEPASK